MKNLFRNLKAKIIIIFAMFSFHFVNAQIAFQDHFIVNTDCVYQVFPSDIDGDGDNDFFAICYGDEENRNITWYENTDGLGNFIMKDIMSTGGEIGTRLQPCDIDGDGDEDLLSASRGIQGNERKVFWHENIDGLGSFSVREIIDKSSQIPWAINASDIDGDGDLDVIASFAEEKITWYENKDSQGTFGLGQIIANPVEKIYELDISDLDGDGDMDILSISQENSEVAWYENMDGTGSFGAKQIISIEINTGEEVKAADIDGDGDQDVVSSSYLDGKIAWYENTNGVGSFSDQNIIFLGEVGINELEVKDMDGDGDFDILSSSKHNTSTKVAWYENINGSGDFGDQIIISTDLDLPNSMHAVDIDGDLDLDIILKSGSTFSNTGKTVWFENLNLVNTNEYTLTGFTINPSLVKDYLSIDSESTIVSIEIYNNVGQLLLNESYPTKVDVSILAEGIYSCIVKDENNSFGIKKIIKIH